MNDPCRVLYDVSCPVLGPAIEAYIARNQPALQAGGWTLILACCLVALVAAGGMLWSRR